jgi:hypothetical protein
VRYVVERLAQVCLATWVGGERGQRGVEVAQVRRPQHDLGQEPGQAARLQS